MALITLKPQQVAELTNDALKNTLGEETPVLTEDLTNVVDIGTSLQNANAYKNFIENLMVATSKRIFRFREYKSKAPKILRDNYEFGQLIQKIRSKLPEAQKNQSWDIEPYASYDDNIYTPNEVEVKLFYKQVAFEVRKSITNEQIKNAFTNATELGNFVSMQFGLVQNRLTQDLDNLIQMTINNMIGETIVANTGADAGVRVINLLTLFKAEVDPSSTLTSDTAIFNKEFLRYASAKISEIMGLMQRYNTQFNVEHFETFTPEDMMHVVLLDKFAKNLNVYLSADTFHDELVKLPYHETIPYLQGMGNRTFKDLSTIKIVTASGATVNQSYIVGVIFDHDGAGVNHDKPSVETHYVKSAQFTNYWYKENLGYFNDLSEQCVVFIAQ